MSHPNTTNSWPWVTQTPQITANSIRILHITNDSRTQWVTEILRTRDDESTKYHTKHTNSRKLNKYSRYHKGLTNSRSHPNTTNYRELNKWSSYHEHNEASKYHGRNESSKYTQWIIKKPARIIQKPAMIITIRTQRVVEISRNQRVRHAAFMREMWLIHVWAMTHSCMWDMPHSCVRHDSLPAQTPHQLRRWVT